MAEPWRGDQLECDVLIGQVDRRLAVLRTDPGGHDVSLAERLAESLKALIVATAQASAADRARVRAAVRYFARRLDGRPERLPARTLAHDARVVNQTARDLGRDDLVVSTDGLIPKPA